MCSAQFAWGNCGGLAGFLGSKLGADIERNQSPANRRGQNKPGSAQFHLSRIATDGSVIRPLAGPAVISLRIDRKLERHQKRSGRRQTASPLAEWFSGL